MTRILIPVTGFVLMIHSIAGLAQPPSAETIVTRAYELERVEDQSAKLNFTFITPDQQEQRVVYAMVWKNMHGQHGYDNKAMFFTEYPPDKRGIAYLGWLRPAGSGERDDEWVYLPELRMTRRLAHRDHTHAHDDDEFGNSLLTREHLDPRPPELDRHQLIGSEQFNDRPHWLVVSAPKHRHGADGGHAMAGHRRGKIIRWIDQADARIGRVQFFDQTEQQVLDMHIDWQRIGDYWLWQRVVATDPRNQARTVLEISETRINTGIDERSFDKRNLERGAERLR